MPRSPASRRPRDGGESALQRLRHERRAVLVEFDREGRLVVAVQAGFGGLIHLEDELRLSGRAGTRTGRTGGGVVTAGPAGGGWDGGAALCWPSSIRCTVPSTAGTGASRGISVRPAWPIRVPLTASSWSWGTPMLTSRLRKPPLPASPRNMSSWMEGMGSPSGRVGDRAHLGGQRQVPPLKRVGVVGEQADAVDDVVRRVEVQHGRRLRVGQEEHGVVTGVGAVRGRRMVFQEVGGGPGVAALGLVD